MHTVPLVRTPCSHAQSFCTTGDSSSLPTRVTLTLGNSITRENSFISYLYITWFCLDCVLNGRICSQRGPEFDIIQVLSDDPLFRSPSLSQSSGLVAMSVVAAIVCSYEETSLQTIAVKATVHRESLFAWNFPGTTALPEKRSDCDYSYHDPVRISFPGRVGRASYHRARQWQSPDFHE
jgi:hypothetical protein